MLLESSNHWQFNLQSLAIQLKAPITGNSIQKLQSLAIQFFMLLESSNHWQFNYAP
jgi:hypothetical protein